MSKHTRELTPERAAMLGRIGGLATASRHDPKDMTAPARRGFLARFERQVDPDGALPAEERERRAQAALKSHMARLALSSADARRRPIGEDPERDA